MARSLFPDEGSRLAYRVSGASLSAAPGVAAVFYTDAAATALADLRVYDGTGTPGAVIAGSSVTTDAYSRLPLFWGPDGVDTLYVVVSGGPATAVYARADDRLDALAAADATEAAARAAGDALALAKAQNLADLADAAAARTNLGLGTAAVQPATAFDPAGSAAAVTTATAAGFAHAVSLPAPSGTDDTAAINALLAANAGKVVRGRPGSTYRISAPLVVRTGTTLDMTGCTVTLIAGSNCNMLRNNALDAGGRDADITLLGGRWDRGANTGSGLNLISLRLLRVDRLKIRDLSYVSTAGKYGIRAADVTDFVIEGITFPSAASDGVHITGPAARGVIRNIQGTTADDLVAFTPADWPAYADSAGDIVDMLVDGVQGINCSKALVKLSGGTGTKARRLVVRNVFGNTSSWVVAVVDEVENGPNDVDMLVIDGVHATAGSINQVVHLSPSVGGTIRVANVSDPAGTQTGVVVQVKQNVGGAPAANVARLIIEGLDIIQGQARNTITVEAGATVGDLVLRNSRFVLTTAAGNVIHLPASTSVVGRILVSDVHLTNCRCLLNVLASVPAVTLVAVGVYAKTCSRLLNALGVSVDMTLTACVFDTITNAWAFVNTSSLVVRGSGITRIGSVTAVQRNASEVVRVINPDLPVDLSLLARNADDVAINTNAALACGTGRAISNGTSWKNLYSGAVY